MTRACGDCTLCCKLVPVKELKKPAGERCVHQRVTGCRIYARRPMSCRLWNCRWLTNVGTHELSRPDRAHYVIDLAEDFVMATPPEGDPFAVPVIQVWVDPKHPHAHRDPALRRYLDSQGRAAIIRYSSSKAFMLAPPSVSSDRQWHEQNADSVTEEEHARHARELGIVKTAVMGEQ